MRNIRTIKFNATTAYIIALIILSATFFYHLLVMRKDEAAIDGILSQNLHIAQNLIQSEMDGYSNVLFAARGLFATNGSISRTQFRDYVASLDITKQYTGVSSVGYIKQVSQSEKANFIASVKADAGTVPGGLPDFKIYPDPIKSTYMVLIYAEPLNGRQAGLGFDIDSDANRKQAYEAARDTNTPVVTGPIDSVLNNGAKSVGIYLPVYKKGMPITTLDNRRAAFTGVVYVVFRLKDLFGNIFPQSALQDSQRIEIFDGATLDVAHLLFDSQPDANMNAHWTVKTGEVMVVSRPWTIRLSQLE